MIPQSDGPSVVNVSVRPTRVQMAYEYCASFNHSSNGMYYSGDCPREEKERTSKEIATYNAALEVLRSYFACEMDYGDLSAYRKMPHPEEAYENHLAEQKMAEEEHSRLRALAMNKVFGIPLEQLKPPAAEAPATPDEPYGGSIGDRQNLPADLAADKPEPESPGDDVYSWV